MKKEEMIMVMMKLINLEKEKNIIPEGMKKIKVSTQDIIQEKKMINHIHIINMESMINMINMINTTNMINTIKKISVFVLHQEEKVSIQNWN